MNTEGQIGKTPVDQTDQFVTFTLSTEAYALPAMMVREIIELIGITPVPHLPMHYRGVINLRGTIVPVIDLKRAFGMNADDYPKHTCVLVVEHGGGVTGLIVDTVADVIGLTNDDIAPPPDFGDGVNTDSIRGMGRKGDQLIIVLDVEAILASGGTADIAHVTKTLGGDHEIVQQS